MSDTTTDFFDGIGSGAGAPTAQLSNVGDQVTGDIVEMFKRDYIPYGAKDPEKREDGSNKQQLVVILQTEQRNWAGVTRVPKVDFSDPNSPEKPASDDDGKRAVYVPEGKNIQFAIGRAVASAQAPFEVGGKLRVTVANLKDTGKGNPLKEHEALYRGKPDGFFDNAQAPAAQSAPAQESAPAAPAAPAQEAAPAAPAQQAAPAPAAQQDPWATSSAPATSEPPF